MRKASLALCLLLVGCQNVTIRPGGGERLGGTPAYVQRQHFYFFGLSPSARYVNLEAACPNGVASQMRAQRTFVDGLLGGITLGIYTPRTAQVWCQ